MYTLEKEEKNKNKNKIIINIQLKMEDLLFSVALAAGRRGELQHPPHVRAGPHLHAELHPEGIQPQDGRLPPGPTQQLETVLRHLQAATGPCGGCSSLGLSLLPLSLPLFSSHMFVFRSLSIPLSPSSFLSFTLSLSLFLSLSLSLSVSLYAFT